MTRDTCCPRTLIGACLLCGVVIISRPPALFPAPAPANTTNVTVAEPGDPGAGVTKAPYDLVGLGFALAVPLLSAWVSIITRELRHLHYSVLVFWFAVGGLAISVVGVACLDSVALFRGWTWVTWLLSLQQAVLGILGSVLMTRQRHPFIDISRPPQNIATSREVIDSHKSRSRLILWVKYF